MDPQCKYAQDVCVTMEQLQAVMDLKCKYVQDVCVTMEQLQAVMDLQCKYVQDCVCDNGAVTSCDGPTV